jgi:hypothetical protein
MSNVVLQDTLVLQSGSGVSPAAPAHKKATTEQTVLVRLLRVEGEARAAKSLDELMALVVNETQLLLRARQSFLVRPGITGQLEIAAGASLGKVDRNIPLLQSLELELVRIDAAKAGSQIRPFQLWPEERVSETADTAHQYPYRDALWIPLQGRTGGLLAGLLLVRDEPWQKNDIILAQRLALSFAQAWYWLATNHRKPSWRLVNRKRAAIAGATILTIACLPVSLTSLAPMEIVAREPYMVTAPMDGVIETIPVVPNMPVQKGDVLVRFANTVLKNRLELAEREVEVADTRVKKTMVAAVSDLRARHDLALAQAEHSVKTAERDYARDMLGRSVVTAERSGLAVFGDKRDVLGKPVVTGERIMEIADPNDVDIRINVPVSDSIVLADEKRAKIFLDSSPLNPRAATVFASEYHAKSQDGGAVAYRVSARFDDRNDPPRLGLRGTAQLYGGQVALIYYILRRPLSAARQWIGL